MTQATFFLVVFYIALLGLGKGVSGASLLAAAVAPRPRDCPDRCGDLTVPYPFGIGRRCSRPNFNLNCSAGVLLTGNIQIESITLETAQVEMVAYLRSTYTCSAQGGRSGSQDMSFNLRGGPFLLSPADNVFTAIGCSLLARLNGRTGSADRYLTGCITTCTSLDLDDIGQEGAPCSGQGCCQASIAPGLSYVASRWGKDKQNNNPVPDNTCQYAFVTKKGRYLPDQMIY